jgi:protease-4
MTQSMSEEDRAIIQQYVNDSFERFKSIVKQGRPNLRPEDDANDLLDPETQRDLATGEIFPAPRAKQYGLVDEIGFIEDAIDRAVELAGLDKDRVRVVEYQRPPSLLSVVGMAQTHDDRPLATILELSAPRAYYLASTFPPLAVADSVRE